MTEKLSNGGRHIGRLLLLGLAFAMSGTVACIRNPFQWTPHPPSSARQPPREFDIVARTTDYNGSPLNPLWGSVTTGAGVPAVTPACDREPHLDRCTSQAPSFDKAKLTAAICVFSGSKIRGHVNWTVAAATGQVLWLNLASDSDFNFMFFPDGDAALTKNNSDARAIEPKRKYIELEFDSRETVQHFATTWWKEFTALVKQQPHSPEIDAKLNPKAPGTAVNAVVYGLLGLDCVHDCVSEYHPVYAMAIETDPTPSSNQWVIFVRNWGNEGFCSALDHRLQLPDGKLRLTLPRTGLRPEVVTKNATQFARSDNRIPLPAVEFDAQSGAGTPSARGQIVLTFDLRPPEEQVDAELVLTLNWKETAPPSTAPVRRVPGTAPAAAQPEASIESPEDRLERALRGTRPGIAEVAARKPNELIVPDVVPVGDFTRPVAPVRRAPAARLLVDEQKLQRDKETLRAVCDTNKPPEGVSTRDFERMCREARK